MPRSPRSLARPVLVLPALAVAVAAALAAGPPPEQADAAASCPKPSSTLASVKTVRAWVTKGRLRVCVDRGSSVRTRDFGPWTGGRIRLDAGSVVWTTRTKRKGRTVERLWARETDGSRRWMGGLRAVPSGANQDDRLRALVIGDEIAETGDDTPAAAWVTRSGAVVLASSSAVDVPGDEPRELVERLDDDQIAAVAKSLAIGQRTTVDESCLTFRSTVLTAKRTADGPEEVLAEGDPVAGDDPPGDTTCTPSSEIGR